MKVILIFHSGIILQVSYIDSVPFCNFLDFFSLVDIAASSLCVFGEFDGTGCVCYNGFTGSRCEEGTFLRCFLKFGKTRTTIYSQCFMCHFLNNTSYKF